MLLSIKQFWTQSITRQLILGMALTHACLMTIFVFDLVHRQQAFMVSQSQKQAIGLSNTLAANGVSWVLANDIVGIEEIIASQSDFPGLTYAIFLDMDNRVIGFTNREKVGQYLDDSISLTLLEPSMVSKVLVDNQAFIDVASPIMFNEQQIGWARVGIDRTEITNTLKLVTRNGLLYTLLAIIVGVIFAYLMGRGLTKAIRTLVESTNQVELGERDVEFVLDRTDELGKLSQYLDKTVKALAMNELTLKQNQRILASQVKDRTFKLERANNELIQYNHRMKDEKDKLDQTYHQLKALQQQLIESEKLSALGSLVAGIAHEVNTPLGVGYTGISTLQEQLDILHKHIVNETLTAEDITEFLEHSNEVVALISKNMQRATQLIKSFKQIAVVQTSEAHYQFSLKEIVTDCVMSLNNKLKKKAIKIDIVIDEKLLIDSEPGLFAQVISNFVMNSVIHGFEGLNTGEIKIHASLTESELMIAYRDNGKGMSSENVKKVYEPFFTTKLGSGGSGLGMHVVYNIITQRFKGEIHCKSTPGEGVSYNIIIPISAL